MIMTKFDEKVLDKINLLNSIFSELNKPHLFENPNFVIDDLTWEYWLKIKLHPSNKNCVSINIILATDKVQIDVDNIHEIFEWSNKDLEESRNNVINFIKEIFTSYILLEYCNSNTQMYLFNANGLFIKKYNLTTSIGGFIDGFLRRNCNQRLFFPIYSHKIANE
jgi:hypothetical protein